MAIIKCKMCGGDLRIGEGSTVCECEYCGTRQTVPSADNEKKLTLFSRAGRLLRGCEFDKAAGVFETIVADFPEEAEAYWGLVLCNYGIEYVDDPATGKKMPTCHRSSFESVLDDPNFEQACENTDAVARRVYRDEARQIEDLRQAILQVSGKEEPYDVFISYKETDENGDRTLDSVIAQDIYKELTGEGYRVFFSRISLEDKLGTEYEPYIFAALNSAKVMLVVGTDYENFDSVWVKNEWSRFLKLIAKGEKKTLIPVFKNMDAYDMPKEFAKLAAQDMGKVGAMQDLVRGVEKIVGKKKAETVKETVVVQQGGGPSVTALMDRGSMALEDSDWNKAKELYEQVLNMDSRNAEAYLGLAMSELKCRDRNTLAQEYIKPLALCRGNKYLARARQFGSEELRTWLSSLDDASKKNDDAFRIEQEIKKEQKRVEAEKRAELERIQNEQEQLEISAKRAQAQKLAPMISAGPSHSVGLRSDGTVIATEYRENDYAGQCDVSGWEGIDFVASGSFNTVGIKSDGTVVSTKYSGKYAAMLYHGQDQVSGMSDIVAAAAGGSHTLGLRADGTVVATKYGGPQDQYHGQCEVSDWRGIVAVATGRYHTVGLRVDGTVIATRFIGDQKDNHGQCETSDWTDIVAIAAGTNHTLGLRANGTVVAVGANNKGQCEVTDWKLFNSIETIEEERKAVKEKRIAQLKKERSELNAELSTIKGLFAGSKKARIEVRLTEIEAELKKLG